MMKPTVVVAADGHAASLFPETFALREEDRWVVANYMPKLGAQRLTLTYPTIAAAGLPSIRR